MTAINIISDTKTLEEKCAEWEKLDYITIDTEFLRTATYWPKLCLIQVGHGGEGVLVDPLSDIDFAPLAKLLQNPKVLKVFHDAKQDVEAIFHRESFCPTPIFDTQIAAQACGFGDSASYEVLVRKIGGQAIDKSARVTDWSKRPLSDKQKIYALSDVTHLCQIYDRLYLKLKKLHRMEWVEPEFEQLSQQANYENPPENAWKNLKFRLSNNRQQRMLEVIAAWREQQAQALDRPRGWILRDDAMRDLMVASAAQTPLEELRRSSKKLLNSKSGDMLLHNISEARKELANQPIEKFETKGRCKGSKNDNKVSMLKLLLKIQCEHYQVAPKLIANSHTIETFAANPQDDNVILQGFRYDVFGQHAKALMEGEISLALLQGKMQIIKTTARAPK